MFLQDTGADAGGNKRVTQRKMREAMETWLGCNLLERRSVIKTAAKRYLTRFVNDPVGYAEMVASRQNAAAVLTTAATLA